jgi:hypothetical protein
MRVDKNYQADGQKGHNNALFLIGTILANNISVIY